MIIGIGTDIVQIPRIEQLLKNFGERFETRWFTPYEREQAANFHDLTQKASYYAKRFAAKEACVKALGTGFRDGIRFSDISVINDTKGKPSFNLSGELLKHLNSYGHVALHLSLSDDYPIALAMVVIEKIHSTN